MPAREDVGQPVFGRRGLWVALLEELPNTAHFATAQPRDHGHPRKVGRPALNAVIPARDIHIDLFTQVRKLLPGDPAA